METFNLLDIAAVFTFHKEQAKQFGEGTAEALGWRDTAGQQKRFEILSQIADLSNESVLDAGCGHGDLRAYLEPLYKDIRYFGIEQIPELLRIAISRYIEMPETVFLQGDFATSDLPATDYVLASGSFNYRNSDPLYALRIIEKLFRKCRKGFGFNLLSDADPTDPVLVAYSPGFIYEYCKQLTPDVVLKKDYLENDFTIFMYHVDAQVKYLI